MQPKQDKANNFNVFIRNGDWLVWIGWAARLNPLINSRPPADIHDCHSHIWRLHNFEQSFDASRLLLNSPFFSSNKSCHCSMDSAVIGQYLHPNFPRSKHPTHEASKVWGAPCIAQRPQWIRTWVMWLPAAAANHGPTAATPKLSCFFNRLRLSGLMHFQLEWNPKKCEKVLSNLASLIEFDSCDSNRFGFLTSCVSPLNETQKQYDYRPSSCSRIRSTTSTMIRTAPMAMHAMIK